MSLFTIGTIVCLQLVPWEVKFRKCENTYGSIKNVSCSGSGIYECKNPVYDVEFAKCSGWNQSVTIYDVKAKEIREPVLTECGWDENGAEVCKPICFRDPN